METVEMITETIFNRIKNSRDGKLITPKSDAKNIQRSTHYEVFFKFNFPA